jgi:hypothetical protein
MFIFKGCFLIRFPDAILATGDISPLHRSNLTTINNSTLHFRLDTLLHAALPVYLDLFFVSRPPFVRLRFAEAIRSQRQTADLLLIASGDDDFCLGTRLSKSAGILRCSSL